MNVRCVTPRRDSPVSPRVGLNFVATSAVDLQSHSALTQPRKTDWPRGTMYGEPGTE